MLIYFFEKAVFYSIRKGSDVERYAVIDINIIMHFYFFNVIG